MTSEQAREWMQAQLQPSAAPCNAIEEAIEQERVAWNDWLWEDAQVDCAWQMNRHDPHSPEATKIMDECEARASAAWQRLEAARAVLEALGVPQEDT